MRPGVWEAVPGISEPKVQRLEDCIAQEAQAESFHRSH